MGKENERANMIPPYFILAINTTNGVESLNKMMKHKFLSQAEDKNVSTILKTIVEKYCPQAHRNYVKNNFRFGGQFRTTNEAIPLYLHGNYYFHSCFQ